MGSKICFKYNKKDFKKNHVMIERLKITFLCGKQIVSRVEVGVEIGNKIRKTSWAAITEVWEKMI